MRPSTFEWRIASCKWRHNLTKCINWSRLLMTKFNLLTNRLLTFKRTWVNQSNSRSNPPTLRSPALQKQQTLWKGQLIKRLEIKWWTLGSLIKMARKKLRFHKVLRKVRILRLISEIAWVQLKNKKLRKLKGIRRRIHRKNRNYD